MQTLDRLENNKKEELLNLFSVLAKTKNTDEYLDHLFTYLKQTFSIQEIIFWNHDAPNNILIQQKSTRKFQNLNNTFIDNHNTEIWKCFQQSEPQQMSSIDNLLDSNQIQTPSTPSSYYYVPFQNPNQPLGIFLFQLPQKKNKNTNILKDISTFLNTATPFYNHLVVNNKLEERNEVLKIINSVGQKLAESKSTNEIYEIFQHASYQILPNTSTIIFSLFNNQTEMIHPAYLHHEGQIIDITQLNPIPLEPPGQGFQSRAIRSKKPLIVNNLQQDLEKKVNNYQKFGTEKVGTQSSIYVPMIARQKVIGVINLQSFKNYYYNQDLAHLFTTLANTTAVAIQNTILFEEQKTHNQILRNAYEQTLIGWGKAVELKDLETENHNLRVAILAKKLAQKLNLTPDEITNVYQGALLHDIGKIAIPDSILNKPGKLTPQEWEIMKQHPVHAKNMLSEIEFLKTSIDIPYYHHEKWDGTGYPSQLIGEEIPFAARIFAIIDVYDALSSDRPYRPAWPEENIIPHLKSQAGHHFDPHILDIFLDMIQENSN